MLNSMTESSFSLLFSRSSSSCKRKHPAQRGRGAAKERGICCSSPSCTISACFTVRGKPSRRKPFLQGGESRLFSISSTTISSLTCSEQRWAHGQEGHPSFIPRAAVPITSAQAAPEPFPGSRGSSHSAGHCWNRAKAACSDLPTLGKRSLPWVSTPRHG